MDEDVDNAFPSYAAIGFEAHHGAELIMIDGHRNEFGTARNATGTIRASL